MQDSEIKWKTTYHSAVINDLKNGALNLSVSLSAPLWQVKGYRVYYTMDPSRPMNEWQIHNVQDSVITTIQNLVTSETYTIQVLAFTSVGDGPFSDPVHVKVMPGGECSCWESV